MNKYERAANLNSSGYKNRSGRKRGAITFFLRIRRNLDLKVYNGSGYLFSGRFVNHCPTREHNVVVFHFDVTPLQGHTLATRTKNKSTKAR